MIHVCLLMCEVEWQPHEIFENSNQVVYFSNIVGFGTSERLPIAYFLSFLPNVLIVKCEIVLREKKWKTDPVLLCFLLPEFPYNNVHCINCQFRQWNIVRCWCDGQAMDFCSVWHTSPPRLSVFPLPLPTLCWKPNERLSIFLMTI